MGDIVNLRRARKQREKASSEIDAAANRVRFGRPKGEKRVQAAQRKLERDRLDAHRLEPGAAKEEA